MQTCVSLSPVINQATPSTAGYAGFAAYLAQYGSIIPVPGCSHGGSYGTYGHYAGRYGMRRASTAGPSAPRLDIRGTQHVFTFSRCIVHTWLILIDNYRELEVESPSSPVTKPRSQAPATQTGPCVEGSDRGEASQEPTPLRSKRVHFQSASHRSLSPQGDYPQWINSVNTAKSVSEPMPVKI